jgi:hypothetical protein
LPSVFCILRGCSVLYSYQVGLCLVERIVFLCSHFFISRRCLLSIGYIGFLVFLWLYCLLWRILSHIIFIILLLIARLELLFLLVCTFLWVVILGFYLLLVVCLFSLYDSFIAGCFLSKFPYICSYWLLRCFCLLNCRW